VSRPASAPDPWSLRCARLVITWLLGSPMAVGWDGITLALAVKIELSENPES
jgi:hypothetical protein